MFPTVMALAEDYVVRHYFRLGISVTAALRINSANLFRLQSFVLNLFFLLHEYYLFSP